MSALRTDAGNPVAAEICGALEAIGNGSAGGSQESATLEFKEDPALRKPDGADAKLIEMLLDEAVCLANGEAGEAHIVLGVSDKLSGEQAFSGTQRLATWIEQRIAVGTVPALRVEAEPFSFQGVRLVWIRIPRQYDVYTRTKGQATFRIGTSCEPLTDDMRRKLRADRANPDFTADASERSLDDISIAAVEEARALLRRRKEASGSSDSIPETTMSLLRHLGLLTRSGTMTIAAELLFCPLETPRISVKHHYRAVPGGSPTTSELSGPLILTLVELVNSVRMKADNEVDRVSFDDGQEVAIPAFPQTAVDEIITNALVHRDWGMFRAVTVDQSPGTFKVTSPGPLPFGVDSDRLLTTPSVPRNPLLMAAMHQLGLAEESSRGFDRMWVSMLKSGRGIPEVTATTGMVEVVLSAGRPDVDFIRAVSKLADEFGQELVDSVTVLLVFRHLYLHPMITLKQVCQSAQVSETEARESMRWLERQGIVGRVRDAEEWTLSQKTRTITGLGHQPVASVSVQEWIEERFRAGDSLTARQIAEEVGMERRDVTEILGHLRNLGRATIDPDGPQRGPTTKWTAP